MKCKYCGKNFIPRFQKQECCLLCCGARLIKLKVNSTTRRMIRNRMFIADYKKDKCCEICGYKKYPNILVFHHKNKEEKGRTISDLMKTLSNLDKIRNEIKKCILICPNCHNEIHYLEKYPKRYHGI